MVVRSKTRMINCIAKTTDAF